MDAGSRPRPARTRSRADAPDARCRARYPSSRGSTQRPNQSSQGVDQVAGAWVGLWEAWIASPEHWVDLREPWITSSEPWYSITEAWIDIAEPWIEAPEPWVRFTAPTRSPGGIHRRCSSHLSQSRHITNGGTIIECTGVARAACSTRGRRLPVGAAAERRNETVRRWGVCETHCRSALRCRDSRQECPVPYLHSPADRARAKPSLTPRRRGGVRACDRESCSQFGTC